MPDQVVLLLFLAFIYFLVRYNGWLKKRYGVSALSFGRLLVGLVDVFLWGAMFDADRFLHGAILFILAAVIFLLLLAVNYDQVNDPLQAIIMTVWHLSAGLAILVLWFEATHSKGKKKKE